jgi:uncharacterized protein YjiS (DUF1127 family)
LRQVSHAFVALHNSLPQAYMRRVIEALPEGRRAARKGTMRNTNTTTILDRYRRWRRYRATVRELQGLTPRELSDLGINRADISRLAREATLL